MVPDVALQSGGVVEGVVTDGNGVRRGGSTVTILSRGEIQSQVQTDRNGRFRVENLRGGVYQFQTAGSMQAFRLWAEGTAPPSAASEMLIVENGQVVRGVWGAHGNQFMNVLSNPWVLAGIVVTAIAVPLALDDNDSSP